MVYAEFQPGQGYSDIEQASFAGQNEGMSMMERASALKEQRQRTEIEQQKWALQRPLLQAKSQADAAQAGADYHNTLAAEQQRAQVQQMLPQARQEFHDLITGTDPDARLDDAQAWMAKYGQIGNVAALKGEWDGYKNVIGQMHAEHLALAKIQAATDAAKDLWAVRGQTAEDVANIHAGATTDAAETRAGATVDAANARANAPTSMQKVMGAWETALSSGDTGAANLYKGYLQKQGTFSSQHLSEFETLLGMKKEAMASGDAPQLAEIQARIDKLKMPTSDQMVAKKIGGQAGAAAPSGMPATPARDVSHMSDSDLNRFFFDNSQ